MLLIFVHSSYCYFIQQSIADLEKYVILIGKLATLMHFFGNMDHTTVGWKEVSSYIEIVINWQHLCPSS